MKPKTSLFKDVLNYAISQVENEINAREAAPNMICEDIRISYDGYGANVHRHFFRVDFLYRHVSGKKYKKDDIIMEIFVDTDGNNYTFNKGAIFLT